MDIKLIIFILISAIALGSAAIVAFSRNLIHSAFALLGVFTGVLGLYIMLSADFVAVVQLIIYIGGILVLIIFAVMLTTKIGERKFSNRAMAPIAAFFGVLALGVLIWRILSRGRWLLGTSESFSPTTESIGLMLLQEYLLPFEIISLLLVLVLVGALVLARREVK